MDGDNLIVNKENYKLYNGDCLEIMDKLIEEGVVFDAIITDPPYGTTKCKWDSVIPFDEMWDRLNKLIKPNGAIILFGTEPFSSNLRISNIKYYRYDWIWQKDRHANFLFAKKQPLKKHENISVFYKRQPTYNPQMTEGKPNNNLFKKGANEKKEYKEIMGCEIKLTECRKDGLKYPSTVQFFKNISRGKNVHPTQKPTDLLQYLIKTYTNEKDLVLDFTMGSGSTGVAAINTGRRFVGIELDEKYFNISCERLKQCLI